MMSSPAGLSPALLGRWLRPGARVYWPGCAGHSPLFERWLRDSPELAAGVWFCGMWIPGINRFDPTRLHADARASSFFMPPEFQHGWQRGATELLPLHYSEAVRWLGMPGRFDVALLHVAPPDEQGRCSLALAADFTPDVLAALHENATVLAHVNPLLPRTNGPSVAASRITAWVEAAVAPLTVEDGPPDADLDAVATQVAALVPDGATLQFGLGRLQAAVLARLAGHRRLRVHAGMVSDGLLALEAAGALAERSLSHPPVCAGVALGTPALYAAVADASLMRFAPVSFTHEQATLAALPRFTAINSALAVDLLGQVNCEVLSGRQVSGVGGLVDFLRGARASAGGLGIVAATAQVGGRDGMLARSRIVPLLPAGPVGVARQDVDTVVTEHGAAALRGLGADARAQALIAIAAPAQRESLQEAWHTLRRSL